MQSNGQIYNKNYQVSIIQLMRTSSSNINNRDIQVWTQHHQHTPNHQYNAVCPQLNYQHQQIPAQSQRANEQSKPMSIVIPNIQSKEPFQTPQSARLSLDPNSENNGRFMLRIKNGGSARTPFNGFSNPSSQAFYGQQAQFQIQKIGSEVSGVSCEQKSKPQTVFESTLKSSATCLPSSHQQYLQGAGSGCTLLTSSNYPFTQQMSHNQQIFGRETHQEQYKPTLFPYSQEHHQQAKVDTCQTLTKSPPQPTSSEVYTDRYYQQLWRHQQQPHQQQIASLYQPQQVITSPAASDSTKSPHVEGGNSAQQMNNRLNRFQMRRMPFEIQCNVNKDANQNLIISNNNIGVPIVDLRDKGFDSPQTFSPSTLNKFEQQQKNIASQKQAVIKIEDLQKLRLLIEQLQLSKIGETSQIGTRKDAQSLCKDSKGFKIENTSGSQSKNKQSTTFIDGGTQKTATDIGGSRNNNQAAHQQSKLTSIEGATQSCLFTSLESVIAPIDNDKGKNLISQLHHRLAAVDHLNLQQQLEPEHYNMIYQAIKKPLKLDSPRQIPACIIQDTSLCSAANPESLSSEYETSLIQERIENQLQAKSNMLPLFNPQNMISQSTSKLMSINIANEDINKEKVSIDDQENTLLKQMFNNESPLKVSQHPQLLDDSRAIQDFLASNTLMRPLSELQYLEVNSQQQSTQQQMSPRMKYQAFQQHQRSPPIKRNLKYTLKNDHRSNSIESGSEVSEPNQQILTVRQSDKPQIDDDFLRCQSSQSFIKQFEHRLDINESQTQQLKTQRILESAQLPLSIDTSKSRQKPKSNRDVSGKISQSKTAQLSDKKSSPIKNEQQSAASQSFSPRDKQQILQNSKGSSSQSHLADTENIKQLLSQIILQQPIPSIQNSFQNPYLLKQMTDDNYRGIQQQRTQQQEINSFTSRQDLLSSSKKVIESLKLIEVNRNSMEESHDTLQVAVDQLIKENKLTTMKESSSRISSIICLNPDEDAEYISPVTNQHISRSVPPPTILNSGIQKSGGKYTSLIRLRELDEQNCSEFEPFTIGNCDIKQYQTNAKMNKDSEQLNEMQSRVFEKFNPAKYRSAPYDQAAHRVTSNSDQVTVFDINETNSRHTTVEKEGQYNPVTAQFGVHSVNINFNMPAEYYVEQSPDEAYSSHSLTSRLHTIQELQNQEESSKSPSSNSIIQSYRLNHLSYNRVGLGVEDNSKHYSNGGGPSGMLSWNNISSKGGHFVYQSESIPDEIPSSNISQSPKEPSSNSSLLFLQHHNRKPTSNEELIKLHQLGFCTLGAANSLEQIPMNDLSSNGQANFKKAIMSSGILSNEDSYQVKDSSSDYRRGDASTDPCSPLILKIQEERKSPGFAQSTARFQGGGGFGVNSNQREQVDYLIFQNEDSNSPTPAQQQNRSLDMRRIVSKNTIDSYQQSPYNKSEAIVNLELDIKKFAQKSEMQSNSYSSPNLKQQKNLTPSSSSIVMVNACQFSGQRLQHHQIETLGSPESPTIYQQDANSNQQRKAGFLSYQASPTAIRKQQSSISKSLITTQSQTLKQQNMRKRASDPPLTQNQTKTTFSNLTSRPQSRANTKSITSQLEIKKPNTYRTMKSPNNISTRNSSTNKTPVTKKEQDKQTPKVLTSSIVKQNRQDKDQEIDMSSKPCQNRIKVKKEPKVLIDFTEQEPTKKKEQTAFKKGTSSQSQLLTARKSTKQDQQQDRILNNKKQNRVSVSKEIQSQKCLKTSRIPTIPIDATQNSQGPLLNSKDQKKLPRFDMALKTLRNNIRSSRTALSPAEKQNQKNISKATISPASSKTMIVTPQIKPQKSEQRIDVMPSESPMTKIHFCENNFSDDIPTFPKEEENKTIMKNLITHQQYLVKQKKDDQRLRQILQQPLSAKRENKNSNHVQVLSMNNSPKEVNKKTLRTHCE